MVLNGFERLSMVGIGLHFPADLLMNQIENLHVYLCILVRLRSNPAVWKSVGKTKNIEILIYVYVQYSAGETECQLYCRITKCRFVTKNNSHCSRVDLNFDI